MKGLRRGVREQARGANERERAQTALALFAILAIGSIRSSCPPSRPISFSRSLSLTADCARKFMSHLKHTGGPQLVEHCSVDHQEERRSVWQPVHAHGFIRAIVALRLHRKLISHNLNAVISTPIANSEARRHDAPAQQGRSYEAKRTGGRGVDMISRNIDVHWSKAQRESVGQCAQVK